ncbi:MAG: GNAT family N-acetyltransferase [Gammaproteobacteria bacterium]
MVSGSHHWCEETALHIIQESGGRRLWIGEQTLPLIPTLPAGRARKVLGRELDILVFDTHFGFDPDALGASVGAVRGGGLVVLLTHAVEDLPLWPDPDNRRVTVAGHAPDSLTQRYLQRVVRVLEADTQLWWLREHRPVPPLPPHRLRPAPHSLTIPPYRTPDQASAVAAVIETALGEPPRATVLTADRGRGKSAALGIAAAQLMREHGQRIAVTAPRRDAIEALLEQATRLLPNAEHHDDRIAGFSGELRFLPPDRLLHERPGCDVVFVDEAAAIPTPLLSDLLGHYPRSVFATTVHGYEGTGRGFALRFQRLLEQQSPDYGEVRLETPIRWAADDPVEPLLFRLLLLDAEAAPDETVVAASPDSVTTEIVDRDRLAEDETLLRETFGLLVSAHYQTSPLDLRHLLDGPNLTVYLQRQDDHVVGTALVAKEGGFDAETAAAIWSGERRPQGHLLAQSLAAYLGIEEAPRHHYARILRIAVHPAAQRRGLGRALIGRIALDSRKAGIDGLGASFGATPELLDFWSACGCEPVRIGMRRDASSGEHSALVLRSLSSAGKRLFQTARERFLRGLPVWLEDPLADLEPALVERLNGGDRDIEETLDEQDWLDLVAFAFALRSYEMAQRPVEILVRQHLNSAASEPDRRDTALLRFKVVERRSWGETAERLGLSGRRETVTRLREALRPLVLEHGPAWVQEKARTLDR